jgi:hypothetical protein
MPEARSKRLSELLAPSTSAGNGLLKRFGRAFAVGVLDAQQELAALTLGVEPVEQRRARAADMRKPVGEGARRVTICDMGLVF